tara:strand:- start:14707 stop:15699 length:993 start_codon:yes stop_codon:yes gene_type:complete
MKSLKKINLDLIALKHRIKIIEEKSIEEKLLIEFPDLNNFYEVLNIDILHIEKIIKNSILESDKTQFDTFINHILYDIEKYLVFYNIYSEQLKNIDIKLLVDNRLSHAKMNRDIAYNDLNNISKKRDNIINTIDRNHLKLEESHPEMIILRQKETHFKTEHNKFREKYLELFDYHHNKKQKYGLYTFIDFKIINDKLNKFVTIINSIKNNNDLIDQYKETIIGMEKCGVFYRLAKGLLDERLDELIFLKILNLEYKFSKRINLRKASTEKFLFIIQCTSEILPLNKTEKTDWENELINNLGLNIKTYRRGNLASNEIKFREKIKNCFLNL